MDTEGSFREEANDYSRGEAERSVQHLPPTLLSQYYFLFRLVFSEAVYFKTFIHYTTCFTDQGTTNRPSTWLAHLAEYQTVEGIQSPKITDEKVFTLFTLCNEIV